MDYETSPSAMREELDRRNRTEKYSKYALLIVVLGAVACLKHYYFVGRYY